MLAGYFVSHDGRYFTADGLSHAGIYEPLLLAFSYVLFFAAMTHSFVLLALLEYTETADATPSA
jgi:hypothetical protein